MLTRLLSGAAASALLAAAAFAQTIHVPDRVLHEGETIDVGYSDASMRNRFVTVRVDDGSSSNPQTDYVEIWLDGSGRGSRQYRVKPGWWGAQFNAANAKQVTRIVSPLPPG